MAEENHNSDQKNLDLKWDNKLSTSHTKVEEKGKALDDGSVTLPDWKTVSPEKR